MLLRRLSWADTEIRKGNYAAFRARMLSDNLTGLEGLLVGIIGLGTSACRSPRRFVAWVAGSAIHDPAPARSQAAQALDASALPLAELLAAADLVTLHVPLLPSTRGLIGERELAAMKPGAVLIQASRGGVVDEAALAAHLQAGHLGGAAVDVYSEEPPPADHPLLTLDRRGSAQAVADAAHRRRNPPILGLVVPLGLAERRTRAACATSRRSIAYIRVTNSRSRPHSTPA